MRYCIASCSCGKDSLAMVYKLLDGGNLPLDEIVFYDTGMEFQAIYDNWHTLKVYAEKRGVKCTVLKPKCPFVYTMLEKPVNTGRENEHSGYSWCGGRCRWGTTEKLKALDSYCEARNAICYVGIACDETERLRKERKPYKMFPLASWDMTEQECLTYCRERGIGWKEGKIDLYDILDRVSCWCCGNKNIWELYNIWRHLHDYWEKLKDLQAKTNRPIKKGYSIFDLERIFQGGYIPPHRARRTSK